CEQNHHSNQPLTKVFVKFHLHRFWGSWQAFLSNQNTLRPHFAGKDTKKRGENEKNLFFSYPECHVSSTPSIKDTKKRGENEKNLFFSYPECHVSSTQASKIAVQICFDVCPHVFRRLPLQRVSLSSSSSFRKSSRYAEQARNGGKRPILYGFWGRFDEMIRIFHEMISE
ncbi:MAG: hypothetical protein IKD78_02775, partial [Bacteroidales bacterium]|nr:hypothetical protein [Bacteroidales bacterium]